ncbi:MAG: hypothetical protein JWQ16_1639 [Novosphingobium sp.]|nr:hypothetical protein [Novosphingobium sp.]
MIIAPLVFARMQIVSSGAPQIDGGCLLRLSRELPALLKALTETGN